MGCEPLIIPAGEYTPYIEMRDGYCIIKGKGIFEDSLNFFAPVMNWIDNYLKNPNDLTKVIIDLDVCDSSVNRRLADFFEKLLQLKNLNKKVQVIWKYHPDDDISLQKGYEFSKAYPLDFIFEPKKDNDES